MNESNRQRKVAQIIQEDFAELFRKQASESGSSLLITVTDVRVTADLGIAKIYLSIFPPEFRKSVLKEIEENKVVQLCYDHLDKFIEIYPKDKNWENKMPKGVKLTVYCEHPEETGFIINAKSDELGIQAFIAKKWIIHSELEKLAGRSIE